MTVNESLNSSNIVAHIGDIFKNRGAEEYLGEAVTVAQHMLQGASLAVHQGKSNAVIAAALLHDIGHFSSEFGTFSMDDEHDRRHEITGAKVLEPFFPTQVTQCVHHHVAAKRYLCATREDYFATLSDASVHSLQLQGGSMSADEAAAFAKNPYLDDIVQVRYLDDSGKIADMQTYDYAYFVDLLQGLVDAHAHEQAKSASNG